MKISEVPYEKTVLVCTKSNSDGSQTCSHQGEDIRIYLKDKIKSKNLNKKIRIVKSGCLGKCSEGPNVMIYPEGKWYSLCTKNDVDELLKLILN
jgi:(2Fe-2S) ferredoxin